MALIVVIYMAMGIFAISWNCEGKFGVFPFYYPRDLGACCPVSQPHQANARNCTFTKRQRLRLYAFEGNWLSKLIDPFRFVTNARSAALRAYKMVVPTVSWQKFLTIWLLVSQSMVPNQIIWSCRNDHCRPWLVQTIIFSTKRATPLHECHPWRFRFHGSFQSWHP